MPWSRGTRYPRSVVPWYAGQRDLPGAETVLGKMSGIDISDTMAELEVRDPDGYVLCIGGPTKARPIVLPT